MESQLEIVCKNPSNVPNQDAEGVESISRKNETDVDQKWPGVSLQSIMNKLRELTKPERDDDDWEIPIERIRMNQNDTQGNGSQGDVFYGRFNNTQVAVKRIKDKSLTNIRHLRDLKHRNIIKFYGISADSSFHYIVMEWCRYGTLHRYLHGGRQRSSTSLCYFAYQIASGMKYLRSKNIIHLDLKPSNILLTDNDILKISDFGTHKVFNDKFSITSTTNAGTYAYMAPEIIRGEPHSFAADVWSYGVVLWETLTCDEPYKFLDSSAVIWGVANNSLKLPVPSSFPVGVKRILDGCWRVTPKERLTIQQVCMLLKGAIHEVNKIPKECWVPLQAEWVREIRHDMNRHLQAETDSNDDLTSREFQIREQVAKTLEEAQKRLHKNNVTFLKLHESNMRLLKDREEFERERQDLIKRQEDLRKREEEFQKKQEEFRKMWEDANNCEQATNQKKALLSEINQLKERISQLENKNSSPQIDLQ